MKAVIMAGGLGTRLRPVSGDIPKPMVPMVGRPMMEHIVELLRKNGFDEICCALGYRAGDIMAHFGDGRRFGVRMEYRVEERALGTAGAVLNCRDFWQGEDFLVISGDCACDFDLSYLMAEHKNRSACASLALYRHPLPLSYGLAVTDSEGNIRCFVEKPSWGRVVTDKVNTGIYALSPRAMDYVPEGEQFDFGHELFPMLIDRGEKLIGIPMDGYWCDVGDPVSYYRCCLDALTGKFRLSIPDNFLLRSQADDEAPEERAQAAMDCPCCSRADVMDAMSELLMDMGATYNDGLRLDLPGFSLHVSPLRDPEAIRVTVFSGDAEYAGRLCLSVEKVIEMLGQEASSC